MLKLGGCVVLVYHSSRRLQMNAGAPYANTARCACTMESAQVGTEIPDIVFGLKIPLAFTTVSPSQRNVGMLYRK